MKLFYTLRWVILTLIYFMAITGLDYVRASFPPVYATGYEAGLWAGTVAYLLAMMDYKGD